MEIRAVKPEELTEITALCRACTENMNQNGIAQWDEIYPDEATFKRDIEGCSLFAAVLTGSQIAGCVVLNTFQDKEYAQIDWQYTGDKIAVIHRLMVLPKFEGKGVAGKLLTYAQETAKILGFKAIRLDMFTQNPRAVAFYKKNGYTLRGTVEFRKGRFFCAEKQL